MSDLQGKWSLSMPFCPASPLLIDIKENGEIEVASKIEEWFFEFQGAAYKGKHGQVVMTLYDVKNIIGIGMYSITNFTSEKTSSSSMSGTAVAVSRNGEYYEGKWEATKK